MQFQPMTLVMAGVLSAIGMSASAGAPPAAATVAATPQVNNRFSVEVEGILIAGFRSIDGLETATAIAEHRDGEDGSGRFRPGHPKPGKLTLSKDWANNDWTSFFGWQKSRTRKQVSIIFHNDAGEETGRINLPNAWCSKWTLVDNASSLRATEVIEITFETIELK